MYKIVLTVALLFSLVSNSQNIMIGQDAQGVKTIVEWTTSKNQKENRFKKSESNWTCDSKYSNGELKEVIQCYQNQYLIDFKLKADYCERFIMKSNILKYTIKEFKNISIERILQLYVDNAYAKYKIENLYFSDDFQYYYKFYLSKENLASVEMHKFLLSDFTKEMQIQVEAKKVSVEKENSDAIKRDSTVTKKGTVFDRKILIKPTPVYNCNEQGTIVIQISVNKAGKVVDAKVVKQGTTNNSECLLNAAKNAAMNIRYEAKDDALDVEFCRVSYNFRVTN